MHFLAHQYSEGCKNCWKSLALWSIFEKLMIIFARFGYQRYSYRMSFHNFLFHIWHVRKQKIKVIAWKRNPIHTSVWNIQHLVSSCRVFGLVQPWLITPYCTSSLMENKNSWVFRGWELGTLRLASYSVTNKYRFLVTLYSILTAFQINLYNFKS